jgi:hypothetical protein
MDVLEIGTGTGGSGRTVSWVHPCRIIHFQISSVAHDEATMGAFVDWGEVGAIIGVAAPSGMICGTFLFRRWTVKSRKGKNNRGHVM